MTNGFSSRATFGLLQDRPVVLVVDDDSLICDFVGHALSDQEVLAVASGHEALALLEQEQVELVLTDVAMPDMNGIALLQQIKRTWPELPVVIMTGYTDRETVLRALQADADDFVDKPINPLQLQMTINRALHKQALKEQLQRLRRQDQLHTQFLGLVSHKLKTPVTAISLILQHLSGELAGPPQDAIRKALTETGHLSLLIEDLLYFSDAALSTAPPSPTPTELPALMREVIGAVEPQVRSRQQTLHTSLPASAPPLTIDRERVRFALRAVLDNAIKFSPPGSSIDIGFEQRPGEQRLRVRDHGPGIDADERERVFDRFYQIDPHQTGQIRGFGLGLAYARDFIREQNGQLELHSCPGEGTTAVLRLPAGAA